jgi:hypothetical protein
MIFNGLWMAYWIWIGLAFSGFGSRSLLIQRCKNYAALQYFFVQGAVLPDERRFYPTNEKRGWPKGSLGTIRRGRVPKCLTFALEKVLSLFLYQTLKVPDLRRG